MTEWCILIYTVIMNILDYRLIAYGLLNYPSNVVLYLLKDKKLYFMQSNQIIASNRNYAEKYDYCYLNSNGIPEDRISFIDLELYEQYKEARVAKIYQMLLDE